MRILSIDTGNFMLDGGAIFGVVPKAVWKKLYIESGDNLINLCMRCLLVDTGDRRILIDTGMGNKQSEKFFSYYFPNGKGSLENSMNEAGYSLESITDVIITHLHFDHVGGAVTKDSEGNLHPTFANAQYYISKQQWHSAHAPNKLEKASFLSENYEVIEQSGKLTLVENSGYLFPDIEIRFFHGHTRGLMVPFVHNNGQTLVYVSDLMPVLGNLQPNYFTSYDIEPLLAMQEKEEFLIEALEKDYTLFFEHDLNNECCNVKMTEKGPRANEIFNLSDWLN